MYVYTQALRQQSEVLAKAEGQLAEGVRVNRENIEEMQASLGEYASHKKLG